MKVCIISIFKGCVVTLGKNIWKFVKECRYESYRQDLKKDFEAEKAKVLKTAKVINGCIDSLHKKK